MAFSVFQPTNHTSTYIPTVPTNVRFKPHAPMIIKKNLQLLLLSASISTVSFSQNHGRKTDVNKDIDVVRVYEQVVKEGYGTSFIYKELATAYYFKSEYSKALTWFQKLVAEERNIGPELTHQYSQTLKAVAVIKQKNSDLKRF